MRSGSGSPALRAAAAFWISAAQATASTTLSKATSAPSPISLMMRPWCWEMAGSISSARTGFQSRDGAGLIGLHRLRVADHIGRQDRQQLSVERGNFHDRAPA